MECLQQISARITTRSPIHEHGIHKIIYCHGHIHFYWKMVHIKYYLLKNYTRSEIILRHEIILGEENLCLCVHEYSAQKES